MAEYIVEADCEYSDELHKVIERIVRCKNCKYWDTSHREPWHECSDKRACINLSFVHSDYPALSNFRYTEPDGFCAWGVNKDV